MFFALIFTLFLDLPYFELKDTIISEASFLPISTFQVPYHYVVEDASPSNFLFGTFLFLKGVNYASPVVAGTTPEQNSYLFSGILLTNPMLGYPDLTLLPSSIPMEIEVLHSSSPLTALPGIGGTVNFIPQQGLSKVRLSNYSKETALSFSILKKITLTGFYETFCDSYPVIFEGQKFYMTNTGAQKYGFLANSEKASFFVIRRKAGAPSPIGSIGSGEKEEWLNGGKLQFQLPQKSTLTLTEDFFHQIYKSGGLKDTHRTFTLRAELSKSFYIVGYTAHFVSSTKIGDRKSQELFLTLNKIPIKVGGFSLFPSLSLLVPFDSQNLIPNFGLSAGRLFSYNIFTFISLSSNYRNPTFNELYWPEDNFARGNPYLKSERGWSAEAGLRFIKRKVKGAFTLFYRRIENAILWVQEDKYMPKNYTFAKHYGFNVSSDFWINQDLSGGLALNLSRSFLEDIPYIYRPSITLSGKVKIYFLSVNLDYMGKRPERPNSTKMMPPVLLINLSLDKTLALRFVELTLEAGVENLLDENYCLIRGYPQPGRNFFVEIKLRRG